MSDAEGQEAPKIQVDADWKAQARAEKEKLQEELAQAESEQAGGPGQMPEANFQALVSSIVSQALLYMGAIPDPMTGQRMMHPDLARHHIDILGVLQEKTKGNLEEDEQTMVDQTLSELRQAFVQLQAQVAAQQAQMAQQGGPDAGPAAGGAGPIITG